MPPKQNKLRGTLYANLSTGEMVEISELRNVTITEADEILEKFEYVRVVRCKDCKYRYVDGDNVRVNFCELNHNKVQGDDWFCADGERREEE